MLNLLKHELLSRRIGILGWSIGLILFGSMYTIVYPEVSEDIAALADLSLYQAMGIDLNSYAGYIASVVVQYLPLMLGAYAIIASTGTLAGEEDRGTLELVLAMPLKRWQIMSVKALALAIVALLILVIGGLGNALVFAFVKTSVEVDVTPVQLFVAIVNGWPITLAFMAMGLLLGAYLPNRRFAAGVLTVIFVASFFGQILVGLVESLESLRPLFLFYYLDTSVAVFEEGVQAGDVLVLAVVTAVCFALALVGFERRNITVGQWPWQRASVEQ